MLSLLLFILSGLAVLTMASPMPAAASSANTVSALSAAISTVVDGLAGVCDMSTAVLPNDDGSLPGPDSSYQVVHIALGRGTQNYTCDVNNSSAVPVAIGAKASLFYITCLAVESSALAATLPTIALDLPIPTTDIAAAGELFGLSGVHFFLNTTTPFFDLDDTTHEYGMGAFEKNTSLTAPAGSMVGVDNVGDGAVPWLKLQNTSYPGVTDTLMQVFRVLTAGGAAPANCSGQAAAFEMQYAAQYWFYA